MAIGVIIWEHSFLSRSALMRRHEVLIRIKVKESDKKTDEDLIRLKFSSCPAPCAESQEQIVQALCDSLECLSLK
jgi:hypothetical protein